MRLSTPTPASVSPSTSSTWICWGCASICQGRASWKQLLGSALNLEEASKGEVQTTSVLTADLTLHPHFLLTLASQPVHSLSARAPVIPPLPKESSLRFLIFLLAAATPTESRLTSSYYFSHGQPLPSRARAAQVSAQNPLGGLLLKE